MSSIILTKLNTLLTGIVSPWISFPIFISLVLVILGSLYTRIARGKYDIATLMKVPGNTPLPVLGNALDVNVPNDKFLGTLTNMCKKHGTTMRLMLAHRPYVILHGPKGFETILSSSKHITKGPDYKFVVPWLGLGLLISKGQKWFQRRKMLTPAFHFKILEDFLIIMNEQSSILVNKLKALKPGTSVDMFPYITYSALDIICESAMGKSINAQSKSETPYIKSLFSASDLIMQRQKSPWMWNSKIYDFTTAGRTFKADLDILHGFTNSIIAERKKIYLEKAKNGTKENDDDAAIGKKKRLAFLDLLFDNQAKGHDLPDQDIREEVDTFMFEGHDTTAANMTFTIYLLALHKDVQKKVQEELDEITGGDREKQLTSEDLANMKYLECCIKESLRLYPSVPLITRTIYEEAVIEGYTIPAGTNVGLFTYLLHRDPEQFPDPEKFDPDRFSANNTHPRHAYSYVPFSAGPRNCIGQKFATMEEKVVVSSVLRNFNLDTSIKPEDINLLPELILRPEGGIQIKITPRE